MPAGGSAGTSNNAVYPVGKSIHHAFNVIGYKIKGMAQSAINAIAAVHGDGDLPTADIVHSASKKYSGLYDGEKKQISLSPTSDNPELTFAHEAGHFLDHMTFGQGSAVGTRGEKIGNGSDRELDKLYSAIQSSHAVQSLKDLQQKENITVQHLGQPLSYPVDKQHISYLLQAPEQFARAYAQYIAIRSNNHTMKGQLETMIAHQNSGKEAYTSQWTHEDFKPIAKEFDAVFKARGWQK